MQFVGETGRAKEAGQWRPLAAQRDVAVGRGDFLGLPLSNDGVSPGAALIPYSQHDWAVSPASGPQTGYPKGILTFQLPLNRAPRADDLLVVGDPAPRTYSFEFQGPL